MMLILDGMTDSPGWNIPESFGELDETAQGEVLAGIGTLIRSVAPFFLLCDRRDIGVAPRVRDTHFGCPAIYIYDSAPGGSGLSEALASRIGAVFAAGAERTRNCPCESGCPSCIGVNATGAMIKNSAVSLMESLSLRGID